MSNHEAENGLGAGRLVAKERRCVMIKPTGNRSGLRPIHGVAVAATVVIAVVIAFAALSSIVGILAFAVKLAIVVAIVAFVVKLVMRSSRRA